MWESLKKHLLEFKRNYGDISTNTNTWRWSSSQHRFSLNLWYSCCKMSQGVKIYHHCSSCLLLTAPFFHMFSSFSLLVGSLAAAPQPIHRLTKGHCVSLIPLQCHRAACAPTKHLGHDAAEILEFDSKTIDVSRMDSNRCKWIQIDINGHIIYIYINGIRSKARVVILMRGTN